MGLDWMTSGVAVVFVAVFWSLSLVHVYWAVGGQGGMERVVPHLDGKPVFQPGPFVTLLVAIALLACGLVVLELGFSELIALPLDHLRAYAGGALAIGFLGRAIGDFKFVGFFKSVKDSQFAEYDTRYYSPLCCILAAGLVFLSIEAA